MTKRAASDYRIGDAIRPTFLHGKKCTIVAVYDGDVIFRRWLKHKCRWEYEGIAAVTLGEFLNDGGN